MKESRRRDIVKALTAFYQMVLLAVAMAASLQTPTTSLRGSPIGVGDIAPDFTLEDQNRNKVTLTDVRGKSPVVLVFYRGYW
jgi:cytochrome oxidase Cu insertion factor (SCO1/SenC/PrrC family)